MEFIKVAEQHAPWITLIQLNRPKELNALNRQMMEELRDTLQQLDKNEKVRVIVITGNEQAFAAGEALGLHLCLTLRRDDDFDDACHGLSR